MYDKHNDIILWYLVFGKLISLSLHIDLDVHSDPSPSCVPEWLIANEKNHYDVNLINLSIIISNSSLLYTITQVAPKQLKSKTVVIYGQVNHCFIIIEWKPKYQICENIINKSNCSIWSHVKKWYKSLFHINTCQTFYQKKNIFLKSKTFYIDQNVHNQI